MLKNIVLSISYEKYSELQKQRTLKLAGRRRRVFFQCFVRLTDDTSPNHVTKDKLKAVYKIIYDKKLLQNSLPRPPAKGCPNIVDALCKAVAEDPDKGLSWEEFISFTEILQHDLEYDHSVGSYSKPNEEDLKSWQIILRDKFTKPPNYPENYPENKKWNLSKLDWIVALLLIVNAITIAIGVRLDQQCDPDVDPQQNGRKALVSEAYESVYGSQ